MSLNTFLDFSWFSYAGLYVFIFLYILPFLKFVNFSPAKNNPLVCRKLLRLLDVFSGHFFPNHRTFLKILLKNQLIGRISGIRPAGYLALSAGYQIIKKAGYPADRISGASLLCIYIWTNISDPMAQSKISVQAVLRMRRMRWKRNRLQVSLCNT